MSRFFRDIGSRLRGEQDSGMSDREVLANAGSDGIVSGRALSETRREGAVAEDPADQRTAESEPEGPIDADGQSDQEESAADNGDLSAGDDSREVEEAEPEPDPATVLIGTSEGDGMVKYEYGDGSVRIVYDNGRVEFYPGGGEVIIEQEATAQPEDGNMFDAQITFNPDLANLTEVERSDLFIPGNQAGSNDEEGEVDHLYDGAIDGIAGPVRANVEAGGTIGQFASRSGEDEDEDEALLAVRDAVVDIPEVEHRPDPSSNPLAVERGGSSDVMGNAGAMSVEFMPSETEGSTNDLTSANRTDPASQPAEFMPGDGGLLEAPPELMEELVLQASGSMVGQASAEESGANPDSKVEDAQVWKAPAGIEANTITDTTGSMGGTVNADRQEPTDDVAGGPDVQFTTEVQETSFAVEPKGQGNESESGDVTRSGTLEFSTEPEAAGDIDFTPETRTDPVEEGSGLPDDGATVTSVMPGDNIKGVWTDLSESDGFDLPADEAISAHVDDDDDPLDGL